MLLVGAVFAGVGYLLIALAVIVRTLGLVPVRLSHELASTLSPNCVPADDAMPLPTTEPTRDP